MELNDLMIILHATLPVCDSLDELGMGGLQLTEGAMKGRLCLRADLQHYLLYLAGANETVTQAEADMLNTVGDTKLSAEAFQQRCESLNPPTPETNISLKSFLLGEKNLNEADTVMDHQIINSLYELYDYLGDAMLALDPEGSGNAAQRKVKFMEQLRSYRLSE